MFIEIKNWFRKVFIAKQNSVPFVSSKGVSKEILDREERLLYLLKSYRHSEYNDNKDCYSHSESTTKYYVLSALSESGIMYRSSSSLDRCFHISILGSYLKHDVDGDVFGTVCKDLETGRIYEFDKWTIYYDREPHDWVRYFNYNDRMDYSDYMSRHTNEELYDKFIHLLPKEFIRDIRLGELGIE